jgi:hypothetical protein
MRWLVFTAACVVALVSLGVLAVDERDVVWQGREPHCPYCRAPVELYAFTCKECQKSFDWVARSESCHWCLDRLEADTLRVRFEGLGSTGKPLPERLGDFHQLYFRGIEEGHCTYCGGLGTIPLNGPGEGTSCPVCFGGKRCIACGGDRRMVFGDREARKRELRRAEERAHAERRRKLSGLPIDIDELLKRDVEALRGYAEAEKLRDTLGRDTLLDTASVRVRRAFDTVTQAASGS